MYPHQAQGYGFLIPGSEYIPSLVRQGTITKEASKRLRWMDYYLKSRNARLTCRYFGISAQTFYRWWNRFDPYDLTTLEDESKRPHRVRRSETPIKVVERILQLRQKYPRWSRD
jgi:putative transposase